MDAAWAAHARRFMQRVALPDEPIAPPVGSAVDVGSIAALHGVHAWLAHWVREA
jgi:hypothetical protein